MRSWNDEHSTTSASCPSRAASGKGRPMLPHATASMPSARRHASIIAVVVVFPFVPVTARYGTSASRAPSSISLQTGRPRARAHSSTGARSGTPGPVTTRVASSRCDGSWPPVSISMPSAASASAVDSSERGSRLAHAHRGAFGREHARGRRARHAGADHDGALALEAPAHSSPPWRMKSA